VQIVTRHRRGLLHKKGRAVLPCLSEIKICSYGDFAFGDSNNLLNIDQIDSDLCYSAFCYYNGINGTGGDLPIA
jgi:hypothetical protein